VRGARSSPEWHSLREVWKGEAALHTLYADVRPSDVPFAQDCVGDQFLLRDGEGVRLEAETGELSLFAPGLASFSEAANANPVECLAWSLCYSSKVREGRSNQGS